MSVTIKLDINITEVERMLRGATDRMENMQPVMAGTVMETLQEIAVKTFEKQGGAWAMPKWHPLTTPYRNRKRKLGLPDRIGVATGTMMRSLTTKGAPFGVRIADKTSATLGTAVKYAGYFNSRRDLFPQQLPKSKSNAIAKAIENYVITGVA